MPKIADKYSLKEFSLHAYRKNSDMYVGIFPKLAISHSKKAQKPKPLCPFIEK